MTKGPWKYQKANGHHHVLIGEESLDVNTEDDARIIAEAPAMKELIEKLFITSQFESILVEGLKILQRMDKKNARRVRL